MSSKDAEVTRISEGRDAYSDSHGVCAPRSAMQYCRVHQRALIPQGYDLRQRRVVPAKWHPLRWPRVALALGYAQAFGCGLPPLALVACDRCRQQAKEDDEDEATDDAPGATVGRP